MTATLDAWDALHLDNTLADLAGQMGRLGDTSLLDARRAHALTLLSHPQQLLDLSTDTARGTSETDAPGRGAASGGTWNFGPGSHGPSTINLYLHATLADLAALTAMTPATGTATYPGCALLERYGPALLAIVANWAGRSDRIIVRPVLDPTSTLEATAMSSESSSAGLDETATRPVDRHDPPDPMREHVILRDGACVFPGCQVDARTCDLDHIRPYVPLDDGGPPGQTHPGNLAPLCRRHHRLKTHTTWHYQREVTGTCSWTDPTGRTYITHPQPRRSTLA